MDENSFNENVEEVTELDLIYESHDRLDVLIELLIDKGIITQKEYENKLDKYYESQEQED